jgi:hypothetical protein
MLDTASQLTAATLRAEADNGVTYADRRFGDGSTNAPPLVFLQHFRGNLDNWDPARVDSLAANAERRVSSAVPTPTISRGAVR